MKTLLVISGGVEAADVARRAREMGLNVVVSDRDPGAPGFAVAHHKLMADVYSAEDTARAAEEFHRTVRPIDGVICADADAPLSQVRSGTGTREGLMNGPVHAAVTAQGAILVLESANNRIQAFDIGGNPVPLFANGAYFVPLHDGPTGGAYLDVAVEYSGYIFVLSYSGSGGSYVYRLDIYTPEGEWLSRTTGINADKLAVNYWRDLFTLNYEPLRLPNGTIPNRTEPSVSHWIPSTP